MSEAFITSNDTSKAHITENYPPLTTNKLDPTPSTKPKRKFANHRDDLQRYESQIYRNIEKHLFAIDMRLPPSRKNRLELISLPARQYLDECITPILYQALKFVAYHRPLEPVNCLAAYLMKHREAYLLPVEKVTRPTLNFTNSDSMDIEPSQSVDEISTEVKATEETRK